MKLQKNNDIDFWVDNVTLTGLQLKKFREVTGMTQAELAELLNMERSNISKLEVNKILNKRVLKLFFEGIWDNGLDKICEHFEKIGVDYPNLEFTEEFKYEGKNLIINNQQGDFMIEENQYFKQKALMMDENIISELNRLKDENNQLKNSHNQKNSEIFNLKTEIVKLEGKIELAEIRFNAALEKLKYEIVDYVKISRSQIKQQFENIIRESESKIVIELNENLNGEFEKLQKLETFSERLSVLLESEHIQAGLGEVLKQSGTQIIMNCLNLINRIFDNKSKQHEVPQRPFSFDSDINFFSPEIFVEQNEKSLINDDVNDCENEK